MATAAVPPGALASLVSLTGQPPTAPPHDQPTDVEQRTTVTTNRRDFLALGAAGTAAMALAGCSSDEGAGTTPSSPAQAGTPGTTPATGGSLRDVILADRPLFHLPLQDDADAKQPAEASGHHRAVQVSGGKWWPNDALFVPAPDAVGRAWYSGFSYDKAVITAPGAETWIGGVPSSGLTFSMWLCQEDANWNQTFCQVTGSEGIDWAFGLSQDGTRLVAEGKADKPVELALPTSLVGSWHHVAISCDAKGQVAGYCDGKPLGTGSIGAFQGKATGLVLNDRRNGGNPLGGCWAHLAIFGSVLGADRIAAQHTAGMAPATPAVRGVDAWFGGPDYYKQFTGAEVFTDPRRFPVAEWWMDGFPEQLAEEKAYADGAVVLDNKVAPETMRQLGLWVVRAVEMAKEMSGTPGAETVGWLPSDEPDMDDRKAAELPAAIKAVPRGMLSYANYGIGVTMSSIDRYKVRPMVDVDGIDQVSADLYAYCTRVKMDEQVSKAWHIKPEQVRRAAAHGITVDRTRAFLTTAKPVWGVVAVGHANNVGPDDPGWGSVPSADEFEGSVWSCIAHGASGILLFPQTFSDSKTAPTWDAKATYRAGDTVRDPKDTNQFWYARTAPKPGVDPRTVTDDSWLGWKPNVHGIREKEFYARGVSDRVAAVKKRLLELSPVLLSRSVPHRFHADLDTRYWPTTPDGYAYVLAMQSIQHDKGTYEFRLPAGVAATAVEVVGEDRTVPVSGGRFTDSFDAEWRHHLYRWKA